MSEQGTLTVRIECESRFLGSSLPIEIRDAWLRVVASGTGSWEGRLPEGLYMVESMTPAGMRMREVVQVEAAGVREVVLTEEDVWGLAKAEQAAGGTAGAAARGTRTRSVGPARLPPSIVAPGLPVGASADAAPPPAAGGDVWLETFPAPVDPAAPDAPLAPEPFAPEPMAEAEAPGESHGVRLVEATGCTVTEEGDDWVCLPDASLPAVPTARFANGGQEWLLSLPLNPATQDATLASCRVTVVAAGPLTRLQLSFSPLRRVTSFVEGARRSRSYEDAGDLLAQATELLMSKYEDPPGAVLGGLTLQRLGALADRRAWVENLAGSFGWIPDARVLLAAVLAEVEAERDAGLDVLLGAAQGRPMFTDGLSLALRLLRAWPSEGGRDRADERREAMERLADLSAWADWDAINLTTVTGEGR